jgi:spore germination cell wall hydrolase CwlJ-like protein
MRFRKLVLCLLIVVLTFNFSIIDAYAAEEVTVSGEQDSKTEDTVEAVEEVTEEVTDSEEQDSKAEDTSKTEETSKVNKETRKVVKATTVKYTKAELRLLSALIYCEANAEIYKGKLAVGIVVMNRVKSNLYPDTIKNVIYQRYQFSPVSNGSLKKALAEYDKGNFTSEDELECIKAAKAALSGITSITIDGKKKDFSKFLSFSCSLRGYTFKLGHHKFK